MLLYFAMQTIVHSRAKPFIGNLPNTLLEEKEEDEENNEEKQEEKTEVERR